MRVDQALAWIIAIVVSAVMASGLYFAMSMTASARQEALLAAGATPSPTASPTHDARQDAHKIKDHDSPGSSESPSDPTPRINAAKLASWGYQGSVGPRYWARLDSTYKECGTLRGQSPVDLDNTRLDPKLKTLLFSYKPVDLTFTLKGQEVLATVSDGTFVEIEGDRYNLHSITLHTPSEHTLQSVPYEMEVQLHHRSAAGDLATIAIFVAAGRRNEDYELLLASIPRGDDDERQVTAFPLLQLLPKKRTYFHYVGSMSRPPCTPDVSWYIFTQSVEAASKDIEKLVKLVVNNSRPQQKLSGRTVKRSNR
jgi:carbonic anhydrase